MVFDGGSQNVSSPSHSGFNNLILIFRNVRWERRGNMENIVAATDSCVPAPLVHKISLGEGEVLMILEVQQVGVFVLVLQGSHSPSNLVPFAEEHLYDVRRDVSGGASDKDRFVCLGGLVSHNYKIYKSPGDLTWFI